MENKELNAYEMEKVVGGDRHFKPEADKDGWSNGAGDKARKCLREMNANG